MGNKIKLCIIPAAGKGTRWAPISGYLPKEMLPLIDKPVIEWVVKEVTSSGLRKIVVVINRQKEAIKAYLSASPDLRKKVDFSFINQNEPLGIAHAILLAKRIVANNPFVVALPDLPTISAEPVTRQLIRAFERSRLGSHIVSFDKFSNSTAHLYGECLLQTKNDNLLKIVHFCPKQTDPTKPHHKENVVRMSGRFIFTPEIFEIIEGLVHRRVNGEISDRTALREAQRQGQEVIGLKIRGHTYDTGYPSGYVEANQAFHNHFAKET